MMTAKNYLTTLNTRPFLYAETKIVAELIHQGNTYDEVFQKVIEGNMFQQSSEDRTSRFCSEIIKRLEELDIFLFNQFLVTDTDTSKAILLYALLKKDQLLFEWMREVVWEKFLVLDWYLTKEETEEFFEKKSKENKTVANWTEETKDLLMDAYHRVLYEVDMANSDRDVIELQPLGVNFDVREYLIERKETAIVEVLLGELVK